MNADVKIPRILLVMSFALVLSAGCEDTSVQCPEGFVRMGDACEAEGDLSDAGDGNPDAAIDAGSDAGGADGA